MSYKVRNSIVLGVLMLLILGVGTYVRAFHLPKKQHAIETEIKRIDDELSNTPNLIHEYNTLSQTVTETKKRWESRNKEIPAEDLSGKTYDYFSSLIERAGGVKLNMIYQGVQPRGNYGFNIYNLRGEGKFDNLYKFIWYIENGRKLFKVNTLTLKGLEVTATDKENAGELIVTFEMTVNAFFATIPELAVPATDPVTVPTYVGTDPFTPVISANLPPNKYDLVEIERSDLKAVIPGKAFIIDQKNNFRTLEPGDEVYLGYVTKFMPDEGKIEATLNKGGIFEKVELKIRYAAPQQQAAAAQQEVLKQ
ncbi:MAG: hypothetical protein HY961_17255 [Ignavibacteriae bacterium]|nr:hypothetical protein [Ignavibacteriota bacterium]